MRNLHVQLFIPPPFDWSTLKGHLGSKEVKKVMKLKIGYRHLPFQRNQIFLKNSVNIFFSKNAFLGKMDSKESYFRLKKTKNSTKKKFDGFDI